MDMDPMMLTILGIIAGVLIVIIIVTLAIRIHASRSRGRLRTRASSEVGNGNPSGNKVVVTTIEELDIDHNSSTASLMVMTKKDVIFFLLRLYRKWKSVSYLFTFTFVCRSWTIEGATIAFVPVAFVVQIQIPPGSPWLLLAKMWGATLISCHSFSNHLPVPVSCNKSVYLWRVYKNVLRGRQSGAAQDQKYWSGLAY